MVFFDFKTYIENDYKRNTNIMQIFTLNKRNENKVKQSTEEVCVHYGKRTVEEVCVHYGKRTVEEVCVHYGKRTVEEVCVHYWKRTGNGEFWEEYCNRSMYITTNLSNSALCTHLGL